MKFNASSTVYQYDMKLTTVHLIEYQMIDIKLEMYTQPTIEKSIYIYIYIKWNIFSHNLKMHGQDCKLIQIPFKIK